MSNVFVQGIEQIVSALPVFVGGSYLKLQFVEISNELRNRLAILLLKTSNVDNKICGLNVSWKLPLLQKKHKLWIIILPIRIRFDPLVLSNLLALGYAGQKRSRIKALDLFAGIHQRFCSKNKVNLTDILVKSALALFQIHIRVADLLGFL